MTRMERKPASPPSSPDGATPGETRITHTSLLRCGMAAEESRVYWENARPGTPGPSLAQAAFEERWFGGKSMVRIQYLLHVFMLRFDAFPTALEVLHRWRVPDPVARQNICHWHLQLTDPLYRAFTSDFLARRRAHPEPTVDRNVTARWLEQQLDREWASATTLRMATALVSCAAESGFCTPGVGPRPLKLPRVSDDALAYLLYLLRGISFEGTVLQNPYLQSLGLVGELLEQRLQRTPGITHHRMLNLHDLQFHHPSLGAWATQELHLPESVDASGPIPGAEGGIS